MEGTAEISLVTTQLVTDDVTTVDAIADEDGVSLGFRADVEFVTCSTGYATRGACDVTMLS